MSRKDKSKKWHHYLLNFITSLIFDGSTLVSIKLGLSIPLR